MADFKTNDVDTKALGKNPNADYKINSLPAYLVSFEIVNGAPVGTFDVVHPDKDTTRHTGIPMKGVSDSPTGSSMPKAGDMFEITWTPQPTMTFIDILTGDPVERGVSATYIASPGEYKTWIESKIWARPDDSYTDPINVDITQYEQCRYNPVKSLKDALDKMGANAYDTTVLAENRPGSVQDGSAITINPYGMFYYDRNKKDTIFKVGKGGKLRAAKLSAAQMAVDHSVLGGDAEELKWHDVAPTGTVFTPRLPRLPSLELLEFVIGLADAGKLIYDFVKAYSKANPKKKKKL